MGSATATVEPLLIDKLEKLNLALDEDNDVRKEEKDTSTPSPLLELPQPSKEGLVGPRPSFLSPLPYPVGVGLPPPQRFHPPFTIIIPNPFINGMPPPRGHGHGMEEWTQYLLPPYVYPPGLQMVYGLYPPATEIPMYGPPRIPNQVMVRTIHPPGGMVGIPVSLPMFKPPSPPPPESLQPRFARRYYALLYALRDGEMYLKEDLETFSSLSFSKQLDEFISTLAITGTAYQNRIDLLRDLRETLAQGFPDVQIYPFGSFLTHLGDDTSDVDVYVDAYNINGGGWLPEVLLRHHNPTIPILNACYSILADEKYPYPTSREKEEEMSDKKKKKKDENVIYLYKKIEPLPHTRVPIIKFTHFNGVNCDLSFENITSLKNSLMISLYMRLHPLVQPLLVVIRYWASYHKLTGSQSIKSYCMVLLALTFLQRKKVVPKVSDLQKITEYERMLRGEDFNREEVGGWDTSFCSNVSAIRTAFPSTINPDISNGDMASIFLHVLQDFFNLYGNKDLESLVVSPLVGDLIPRLHFSRANMDLLPEGMEKYKMGIFGTHLLNTSSSLVVQDPFVLNFNVGGVTPSSVLRKFQSACRYGADVIQEQLREGQDRNPFLFKLFMKPLPTNGK